MAGVQPVPDDIVARSAPWGLRLVSDTTSEAKHEAIAVDIVAVHGLGANPDHAWVRHRDTSAGLEEDVRWLTDLLPRTLREYRISISARIFCFNYQSAWLGPQLSRNRLENVAVRLLDDIHNVRDKDGTASDRPLIFIGHSFGGLVIEQAIVQANSVGGRYEYLVKLVGGVVLLGTPHQGSKSQKWGSIIANLAILVGYGEDGLMKEVDEKSMKIFDLISDFKKIMISADLAKTAVVCFYENRPTNYLSRVLMTGQWIQRQTSSIIVEENSAILSGFHSIVLDSDHLKLNKFPSARDGNYVSVSSNLCRIAAETPEIIQRRRKNPALNQNSHYMVPRKRVKDFIGRESLLQIIRSRFSSNETGSPLNLVLYALGGQGKSQIALEYCRRWRDIYRGIFWIDANSATTVAQSCGNIAAELMGGPQIDATDSAAQIKMVKGHLERWNEAWLLVFDNYDEPEKFPEVEQFIPSRGHGHVIFTSRNRDLGRLGMLLEIPPMATEEGVMLLLRGFNGNDIQNQHRETASKITKRLGELALAIDQAAAYIKYKRIPLDCLEDFLTTYEAERQKVLSYTPKNFWEYEHINAFTTWELSFQQLVSGDEPWKKDAGHFLTLSAFFAPTTISESIFRNYQKISLSEPEWIKIFTETCEVQDIEDTADNEDVSKKVDEDDSQSSEVGCYSWDSNRFWDVIARSDDLSLLQSISPGTGHEGAIFSLHPLIRDWLQLRLRSAERAKYTHEAIQALVCCASEYKSLSTSLSERTALITHMDASLSNDENFSRPQDRLGHQMLACVAAGWFADTYYRFGRYRASEDLNRRALDTRRSALGEKHPKTLRSMHNVAHVLYSLGKYKESERMHRQTLALREIELGKEHSDTLISMSCLGLVLADQGKYGEAESMHRHTLTLRETVLGKEHPSTLVSMSNLASVLGYRKKYEEAECICGETLALRKTIQGKEHPLTLCSMHNLAILLSAQKKWDEAERLCRETLTLRETILGKEHPNTLKSMQNLATFLDNQKKWEEAEPLYRETLMLTEKTLGKEHPNTLIIMNNLAVFLDKQKEWDEAERLHRETLMLREKTLGKEHPDTLMSMDSLAVIFTDQERSEEAERIFRETLRLRGIVLGKDHPDTLLTRNCLTSVLRSQGKHEDAELIAADEMTEQSETSGPPDDPASSDPIDVGRPSLITTLGPRLRAQLPKEWQAFKGDEDDGGDGKRGGKQRERGSRGSRISSRLAERTMNALHRLRSSPKNGQDHRAGTKSSAKPIRGAKPGHQMQSSSQASTN